MSSWCHIRGSSLKFIQGHPPRGELMPETTILRFPTICPRCSKESLSALPLSVMSAEPADPGAPSITSPFLAGGAEMGARIRAHDWSATPLGDPSLWPPSLSTTIGIVLNSGQPMCVAWVAELTLIYNDAYAEILGVRHPAALGRRSEEHTAAL